MVSKPKNSGGNPRVAVVADAAVVAGNVVGKSPNRMVQVKMRDVHHAPILKVESPMARRAISSMFRRITISETIQRRTFNSSTGLKKTSSAGNIRRTRSAAI